MDGDGRGYGLPLVTTDLESAAEELVARYAARWGIEQAFADARQVLGVGEARNRVRRAVERTVPFGLTCLSLITVWYALHGHAPEDALAHRVRARWYTTKNEPFLPRHGHQAPARHHRREISRVRALNWPHPKKPERSSPPGPEPEHDRSEPRNTKGFKKLAELAT
jgi:hypothetical protein